MEQYPTQREIHVERLTVLDLDRHIFNTELFHAYVREAAWQKAKITGDELDAVKKKKENAGKTLHTDELIIDILSSRYKATASGGESPVMNPDQQLMDIFTYVMEMCDELPGLKDTLYMPGAKEFIDGLR